MTDEQDHYDVLGLAPSAPAFLVKKAYTELARRSHPDHGGDGETMRSVQAAYDVLGDPGRRAAYDAERAQRAHQGGPRRAGDRGEGTSPDDDVADVHPPVYEDEWGSTEQPAPDGPSYADPSTSTREPSPRFEWENQARTEPAGVAPQYRAESTAAGQAGPVGAWPVGAWPSLRGDGALVWAARVSGAVVGLLLALVTVISPVVLLIQGNGSSVVSNIVFGLSLGGLAYLGGGVRARGGPVTKRYLAYVALCVLVVLLASSGDRGLAVVAGVWVVAFVIAVESANRLPRVTGRA